MSLLLSCLLGIIILCGILFCAVIAVCRTWKEEQRVADIEAGFTPEGDFQFPRIYCPNASGSNLSVRAAYQTSTVHPSGGR